MSSTQSNTEQTRPTKEVELRLVSLADISDVHDAILELERTLSLVPLSVPSPEMRNAKNLRPALAAYPVWLARVKEKFVCVGNVRMYRLANLCMSRNDEIPALVFKARSRRDVVQMNYLVERYGLAALFALELDDVRCLHDVWKNNLDNQQFKAAFPITTTTAFANAFHVSPRSLRNHAASKPEQK